MVSPIQVIENNISTPSSQALVANTWTDLTGLTATITPANIANDIICHFVFCGDRSAAVPLLCRLVRDGTPIGLGIPAGLEVAASARFFEFTTQAYVLYVDSPGTNVPTTYKLQAYAVGSANTVYLQRDGVQTFAGSSQIVLTEIG